jgi:acyl-CoA synthetase (AMP-forming)/AMP-acid ligase II/surfactin synthase thioesterase subunit
MNASTLRDVLRDRGSHSADATALSFLTFEHGKEGIDSLSYSQLDTRARAIAARLLAQLSPGDRVILAYPSGLEFISAFFGCMYAGIIAVPVAIPRPHRQSHIAAIAADCCAKALLCADEGIDISKHLDGLSITTISTTTILDQEAEQFVPGKLDGESTAFLQYTSGSTASPKGVIVLHRALLANVAQIGQAFQHDVSCVAVHWLPMYHDMGLIGTVLHPIYAGFPSILMSPIAFLQRPERWLRAIQQFGGTTAGGPAFGYRHCIERISESVRAELDLSSWRVAYCGAEPIHSSTLRRFAQCFEPSGFSATSFLPCYGLAEATLFVSSAKYRCGANIVSFDAALLGQNLACPMSAETTIAREIVSCGVPAAETEIVIADNYGQPLPHGRIGEIRVHGPSIGPGYWKDGHASTDSFVSPIRQKGDRNFLHTGDLGFFHDGELFVTGRMKDLIILDGRNIAPQDLEWTAQDSHPRVTAAAAFALGNEDGERAIVLVEISGHVSQQELDDIVQSVRTAIGIRHDIAAAAIRVVKTGGLPRTTSGKISRSRCNDAYQRGDIEFVKPALSATHHAIASPSALAETPWLLRSHIHPSPSLRLYCFNQGGGCASAFLPWRGRLDSRIEICPIQLPGRESRYKEDCIVRIELLYQLFEDIGTRTDPTPFAFFGYCLGGRIAFAIARHLRRCALPLPSALLLAAVREPNLMPRKEIPTYRLSNEELLGYAKRLGEIPSNILGHPQAVERTLRLFRADIELSETIPFPEEPPFDCPLAVFGGRQDTAVRLEHLTPWSTHTTGPFTLQWLEGGHLFIDAQRDALLRQIAVQLAPFIGAVTTSTEQTMTSATLPLSSSRERGQAEPLAERHHAH